MLSQNQVHEPFPAQGLKLNYMIILSPSNLINSVGSVLKSDAGLCMQDPYLAFTLFPHGLCVPPRHLACAAFTASHTVFGMQ